MLCEHLTRNSNRDTCTITNEITNEHMVVTAHGSEFIIPNIFLRKTRETEEKWIYDVAINKNDIKIAS